MNKRLSGGPDPWLREALRHAPDGELVVPAGVRDGILRAARQAAVPAAPARAARPGWRAVADAWLRPARLGYSGAFMALLVLGIWGVDQLDTEAGRASEPAEAGAIAAAPAAAPANAPANVSANAPANAPANAAATTVPTAPAGAAPELRLAATRPKPAVPAPAIAAKTRPAAGANPPSRPAVADAQVKSLESPAPVAPVVIAARPVPPPSAPPQEAVVPAHPAAEPVAAAAPALPSVNAPPSPAAGRIAALARANMSAPATTMAPRAEAAPDATLPQARVQLRAAAADPVGLLLRRLATEPTGSELRWSSPGHESAHAAAQAEWLRLLQAETAGRWQRVAAAGMPAETSADAGAPASVPASSLRLLLRSAPVASFAFTSAPTSAWLTIDGTSYRTPLSEAAAMRLETLRAAW